MVSTLRALVPRAPDFVVDEVLLWSTIPELQALAGCRQNHLHHAEGDVDVHTRMVLASLTMMPAFRALPDDERFEVFYGCALHDVAKPETTTVDDDGRVHARGHSQKGAVAARRILWEMRVPFAMRERICGLIRRHQLPFFAVDHDDKRAERELIGASMIARLDHLALVAEADARGRECADQQRLLDNIDLFREMAADLGCARDRHRFVDDVTRFAYFRDDRRTRHDVAHDAGGPEVIVLSGLPASGKDRWCAANAGDRLVISLDALRDELDVEHGGPQRVIIDAARERAKVELRAGRGFVWNATSLVHDLRAPIVDLAVAYGARPRIVYLEGAPDVIASRNRARPDPVPANAIARMLRRWDVPTCLEALSIDYVVDT